MKHYMLSLMIRNYPLSPFYSTLFRRSNAVRHQKEERRKGEKEKRKRETIKKGRERQIGRKGKWKENKEEREKRKKDWKGKSKIA
jgi:hypothetical protein